MQALPTYDMDSNLLYHMWGIAQMNDVKYSAAAMLEQCRSVAASVWIADEQIERLQSMLERVTASLSCAPGRGKQRDMADRLAKIDEIRQSTAYEMLGAVQTLWTVNQMLIRLPEQQENVLRAYYILALPTWRDVALRLHYSESHCFAIRAAALDHMQNMLDSGEVAPLML